MHMFNIIFLWTKVLHAYVQYVYIVVGGPIKLKFELVRALMHDIVACKYEKDQMNNSQEKVKTPFFPS